jgi:7-cyano-7-deazaguanine reductase
MPDVDVSHLKSLGQLKTAYTYSEPDKALLERFDSPIKQGSGFTGTVHIECPEFTSLCPKTGQPDFATIEIEYQPRDYCVESKSLKLYLGSFRMHGEFHEACVQRIAGDLVELLDPEWLHVIGKFTPRGGIPFHPTVVYHRPQA